MLNHKSVVVLACVAAFALVGCETNPAKIGEVAQTASKLSNASQQGNLANRAATVQNLQNLQNARGASGAIGTAAALSEIASGAKDLNANTYANRNLAAPANVGNPFQKLSCSKLKQAYKKEVAANGGKAKAQPANPADGLATTSQILNLASSILPGGRDMQQLANTASQVSDAGSQLGLATQSGNAAAQVKLQQIEQVAQYKKCTL